MVIIGLSVLVLLAAAAVLWLYLRKGKTEETTEGESSPDSTERHRERKEATVASPSAAPAR